MMITINHCGGGVAMVVVAMDVDSTVLFTPTVSLKPKIFVFFASSSESS